MVCLVFISYCMELRLPGRKSIARCFGSGYFIYSEYNVIKIY